MKKAKKGAKKRAAARGRRAPIGRVDLATGILEAPREKDPLPNPFMDLAPNKYEGRCVGGPLDGLALINLRDVNPVYRFRDGISELQGAYHFDGFGLWQWRSQAASAADLRARR